MKALISSVLQRASFELLKMAAAARESQQSGFETAIYYLENGARVRLRRPGSLFILMRKSGCRHIRPRALGVGGACIEEQQSGGRLNCALVCCERRVDGRQFVHRRASKGPTPELEKVSVLRNGRQKMGD